MRKAYIHIDVSIAIGILIFIIFISFSMAKEFQLSAFSSFRHLALDEDSKDICSLLVNSKGFPTNWSQLDDVQVLGFQKDDKDEINLEKFERCGNSLHIVRNLLHITSYPVLKLYLVDDRGNFSLLSQCGKVSKNYRRIVKHSCYSHINDSLANLEVILWE